MANSSTDLIIPVVKFLAKTSLPVSDANLPGSYNIDFGTFEKGALKVSGDLKEVWKANSAGYLGLDVQRRVKARMTYEFELKHLSPAMLAYYLGAATGSAPIPGKVVDIYGWAAFESEGETVVGAGNTNEGSGILVHHSFAAALMLDGDLQANGDDFAMLKVTAEVYLGRAPGVYLAGSRPITAVPA